MKYTCIVLAGALIAGEAAAFAPSCTPALRSMSALRMTQEPPPAILELPIAKIEAVSVNAQQWGIGAAAGGGGGDVKSVVAKMKKDLEEAEAAGAAALPKAVAEQEVLSDIASTFMSKINKISSSSTDKLSKM